MVESRLTIPMAMETYMGYQMEKARVNGLKVLRVSLVVDTTPSETRRRDQQH